MYRRDFHYHLPPERIARYPAAERSASRLLCLDVATRLESLKVPPGSKLEKLSGHRAGQYSIRINEQWRVCFLWRDGDAYAVEIVNYH